jgi:hypothetical protein
MGIALEARRLDQVRESLARAPLAEVRSLRPSEARDRVLLFHGNQKFVCARVVNKRRVASTYRVRGLSF